MASRQISIAKQVALTPIDDKEVIRPPKATARCDKNYHMDYNVLHGRQNEQRLNATVKERQATQNLQQLHGFEMLKASFHMKCTNVSLI